MRKGEARKQAIMETAEALFLKRGYDNTSVQDILGELRLSKGGFYHHFESKQSLLEAICAERSGQAVKKNLEGLAEGADALKKLNAIYACAGLFSLHDPFFTAMLIKAAYRPDGAQLRDTMLRAGKDEILPRLQRAVLQGIGEGVFHPYTVDMMGKLIYLMGNSLFDEIAEALAARREDAMAVAAENLGAYRQSVETLLNAPYGSVQMADIQRVEQVRRALEDARLA